MHTEVLRVASSKVVTGKGTHAMSCRLAKLAKKARLDALRITRRRILTIKLLIGNKRHGGFGGICTHDRKSASFFF